MQCGNVTFLAAKKVTKEGGIGEAPRKSALPYVPHPPHRWSASKNVPIFERLKRKKLIVFCDLDTGKSEHFPVSDGDAAQGILKGTCLFGMSP